VVSGGGGGKKGGAGRHVVGAAVAAAAGGAVWYAWHEHYAPVMRLLTRAHLARYAGEVYAAAMLVLAAVVLVSLVAAVARSGRSSGHHVTRAAVAAVIAGAGWFAWHRYGMKAEALLAAAGPAGRVAAHMGEVYAAAMLVLAGFVVVSLVLAVVRSGGKPASSQSGAGASYGVPARRR
jgi:hypothetical protein